MTVNLNYRFTFRADVPDCANNSDAIELAISQTRGCGIPGLFPVSAESDNFAYIIGNDGDDWWIDDDL